MKRIFILFIYFTSLFFYGQDSTSVISLSEYLGYVKAYHPIVKQANLIINESEAKLMKARGAFDPKLEVDYERKKFKNSTYFDKLNGAFKIPTWYGIELKGNFDETKGVFLNPENFIPDDGLYGVGVSVPLAKNLLINDRMAALKQAKLYVTQAQADRQITINNILFDATRSYFEWLKTYNERELYRNFLENAEFRFNSIKTNFEYGESAAIDTVEARITLNDRKLNLEKANVKYIKASLELSNFLWLNDNTPIEIQDNIIPDTNTNDKIDDILNTSMLAVESLNLDDHPKIRSLDTKIQSLTIERRLKANNLLPKIDLQYNFLSQTPDIGNSFNTANYKSGLNISFPLFLRKERADLKLAKLKLQNTQFELQSSRVMLSNKITAINKTLESFTKQNAFLETMVSDYNAMLTAEVRKLFLGESSLFLVNSRESKLIDAELKAIALENEYFNTKASLFNVLAVSNIDE
ncbi:TolC family protein [Siansivirga zeaxanthinifaciens]|uniref:Transporter n=1 Tax=Siansivirga zeaxanthinifaciens CC-SAMT-1 TaxID=1454006 RepID=A0A0C5VWF1_9FLAO|nr:TolC family protein [Siansivirga zeaxanthinifaciens]AJR03441.1 transporter [Siansivirga zeaxanthinifaciens CC-SAMT-1]